MYDRVFNYNCKHWTKRGGLEHGSSIKSNTFSYRYLKDIWMDNINVLRKCLYRFILFSQWVDFSFFMYYINL